MEKGRRDTVLLTVIAIATLLVAIVGATFAYFTAQLDGNNRTSTVTIKSSTGAVVTYYSANWISDANIYPSDTVVWATKPFRIEINNANATYDYNYALYLRYTNEFASDQITYSLERATGYCDNNVDITKATCEAENTATHTQGTWISTGSGEDVEQNGVGQIANIAMSTANGNNTYIPTGSNSADTIRLGGANAVGTFAANSGNSLHKVHAYVLKIYYPNKADTNQNSQQGNKIAIHVEAKEVANTATSTTAQQQP